WATDPTAFEPLQDDTLEAMRKLVTSCRMAVPEGLPRALACLVGYFAYETIGLVEKLPRGAPNPLDLPDMLFARPTIILIFDRLADQLFMVAPLWPDTSGTPEARVAAAIEQIETHAAMLAGPLPPQSRTEVDASAIDFAPQLGAERYSEMVLKAKDYIAAGDIFQVVLAQRFTAPFALPPVDLYRALRRINPSPFLYFLDLPGFALIGSSPEILVRARDGEVTIRPIAGTRPRGKTAAEDVANRESLLADPKERAEHLMLLDLGRNDVGRVALAGTVEVTDSYTVEHYSRVMHIVSNVVGRLDPAKDALDALFAGFPAGTVSGAPKVRACEIIAELEPETRGAYAGGVGYFSPDGSMDSCIVLRTAVVKDGVMHVQAGAGIVADSDPVYEQRECEAKAGALIDAAREALRRAGEPSFGQ
ncbi:MAG: anthranilate synthase component I, partial [Sphingomonadales bacterium]